MKQFELRYLDRRDFVILRRIQNAKDDLAALAQAEQHCATHIIEVWDGARKVARVNKGNRPETAISPMSRVRRHDQFQTNITVNEADQCY
jgi:hypothetical protein